MRREARREARERHETWLAEQRAKAEAEHRADLARHDAANAMARVAKQARDLAARDDSEIWAAVTRFKIAPIIGIALSISAIILVLWSAL